MLDHAPTTGADLDSTDCRGAADRLRTCRQAFLAQSATRRLGSLQIVDLSRLRQRLGSRWPELRCRVADVIDTTLARSLGPGDLSLLAGEDCRYVLRIGAERRELERRGDLLAAEATARLCGTIPGGAAIRVRTVAFDLDGGLDGVTSIQSLRVRLSALGLALDHGHGQAAEGLPLGLRPRFLPILNLRKRLVSAYQLAAAGSAPSGDGASRAQLDQWSLDEAAQIMSMPRGAREPGLVVSISYTTLAAMRWREPFMQQCRRLPARSSGLLIAEVVDLPSGLPHARLRELMAYIRPFCLLIVARVPILAADLSHFAASGIGGLSVAASSLPVEGHATVAALAGLAGAARAQGLRSCLVEAMSATFCRAALAAGIDHLSGDTLMPPLTGPGRAFLVTR